MSWLSNLNRQFFSSLLQKYADSVHYFSILFLLLAPAFRCHHPCRTGYEEFWPFQMQLRKDDHPLKEISYEKHFRIRNLAYIYLHNN
jgi:hypothetical protein